MCDNSTGWDDTATHSVNLYHSHALQFDAAYPQIGFRATQTPLVLLFVRVYRTDCPRYLCQQNYLFQSSYKKLKAISQSLIVLKNYYAIQWKLWCQKIHSLKHISSFFFGFSLLLFPIISSYSQSSFSIIVAVRVCALQCSLAHQKRDARKYTEYR